MSRPRMGPYVRVNAGWVLDALSRVAPVRVGAFTIMIFLPIVVLPGDVQEHIERHEAIHVKQMIECASAALIASTITMVAVDTRIGILMLILAVVPFGWGFWIPYVASFAWGVVRGRSIDWAYMLNLFEDEAYKNEANRDYLKVRTPFAWFVVPLLSVIESVVGGRKE